MPRQWKWMDNFLKQSVYYVQEHHDSWFMAMMAMISTCWRLSSDKSLLSGSVEMLLSPDSCWCKITSPSSWSWIFQWTHHLVLDRRELRPDPKHAVRVAQPICVLRLQVLSLSSQVFPSATMPPQKWYVNNHSNHHRHEDWTSMTRTLSMTMGGFSSLATASNCWWSFLHQMSKFPEWLVLRFDINGWLDKSGQTLPAALRFKLQEMPVDSKSFLCILQQLLFHLARPAVCI